jgi:hypothetical protein
MRALRGYAERWTLAMSQQRAFSTRYRRTTKALKHRMLTL